MRLKQQLARHRQTRAQRSDEVSGEDLTPKLAWIYFVSGIPALLYQTVWQRLLVLHSGVGTTSIAIIVGAYMLGIGLGSLAGGRLSRAVRPDVALAWFAAFEVLIGLCALASPTVLYDWMYLQFGSLYENLWLACLLHLATLIIPTSLMGATLPLVTRALVRDVQSASRSVGTLYGFNAFGAAFGAMIAPWYLLPFVGVVGAVRVGATCNFAVALLAFALRARLSALGEPAKPVRQDSSAPATAPLPAESTPFSVWMALYFFSGLCAIGLEIVWFRILDVAVKSTSFTFGTILATYLACMACGSIVAARRVARIQEPLTIFLWIQCLILATAAVPVMWITYYPASWPGMGWFMEFWAGYNPVFPSWSQAGATFVLYLVLPLFLMSVPTFLMGYSFSVLQRGVQRDPTTSGYRVGLLQCANIVGCTVGSLVTGLGLIGALGTLDTLRFLVALGAVFAIIGVLATRSRRAFVACVAAFGVLAWSLPEKGQLWRRLHGVDEAPAYVAEDITGVAALTPESNGEQWRMSANGIGQSHLPFGGVHSKLGALPVTLHRAPKAVAIIGLGSGDTAWAAACRAETELVRVFEICTSEATVLKAFAADRNAPQLERLLGDPRIRIDGHDGRHSLITEPMTYDLIEADAIRPNGSYGGYLYSVEFFRICAQRLKPQGLMCSWSPTPRTHVTFRQAFPYVIDLDQSSVLIGSNQPIEVDLTAWRERIRSPAVAEYLGTVVVDQCLGSLESVRALPAPVETRTEWINTDLFPYDEFHEM